MELIGLSGYARSGKDEAAKALVENHGFTRIAFADKLREVLLALNPIVGLEMRCPDEYHPNEWIKVTRLNRVIEQYGWNGYKETEYVDEIRGLLQRLGTEAGRQTLWDSIWVDAALNNLDPEGRYVVTDCRFPNEAQAIRALGGEIWRVSRRGVGPANSHASETSLDNWEFDQQLLNDSTLEEYHQQVGEKFMRLNRYNALIGSVPGVKR